MNAKSLRRVACALLFPLVGGGCGDDAESAATPARPVYGEVHPWSALPPDSLYGATAVENLRTTHVEIPLLDLPTGWDGMRIAAISDFQIGLWDENDEVAAAAVRRAVELNPDLIVLLGDYLAVGEDTATLARVLLPLRGRRVLAVLGDRDVRTDSVEASITRTLRAQGIEVLDNSVAMVERNGSTGAVGGLDPGMLELGFGDQEYLVTTLGGAGTRMPLLLTHVPPLAARAPEDKFGAVLAGNTFCGPIEVPGTPRLSWLRETAIPGAAVEEVERLFRIEGATMFVTCGTGYSFVPARFAYPPEVALVTLRAIGVPTAEAAVAPDSVSLDTLLERYQTTQPDTAGG